MLSHFPFPGTLTRNALPDEHLGYRSLSFVLLSNRESFGLFLNIQRPQLQLIFSKRHQRSIALPESRYTIF